MGKVGTNRSERTSQTLVIHAAGFS